MIFSAAIGWRLIARGLVIISVLAVVSCLYRMVWRIQPWMSVGQSVFIGDWQFGEHKFQIWQRKAAALQEPFATGLFVRTKSGMWYAYCLDHQDLFKTNISLRKEGNRILILRSDGLMGGFDSEQETFHRASDNAVIQPQNIEGDPPSSWWLHEGRNR